MSVDKVAENSDGSDVLGDGQLSTLVARDRERQSDSVSFVVVAGDGPSSRRLRTSGRRLDAASIVEDPDGTSASVGDKYEPVLVGADAVRLQQRLIADVRRSHG